MISVPKRRFPLATRRNYQRRLIREAYRRNKLPFYARLQTKNCSIAVIFLYTASGITTFNELEIKIKVALDRLASACGT